MPGLPAWLWVAALLVQVAATAASAGPGAGAQASGFIVAAIAGAALLAGARALGALMRDPRLGAVTALLSWFGSPLWVVAASGPHAVVAVLHAWGAPATLPRPEALLGLLLLPTRGLVWFAPLLAVAPLGWRAARTHVERACILVVLAGYLAAAMAPDWRGREGYGVRLLLPLLPLLAPGAARLLARQGDRGRAALAGLALTGFAIGACALVDPRFAAERPPGALLVLAHPLVALVALLVSGAAAWRLLRELPTAAT
jgi:hypothetical protein